MGTFMSCSIRRSELTIGADNAAEMADNTLDMMVGRELKGDDFMSVNEMRDELYLCNFN